MKCKHSFFFVLVLIKLALEILLIKESYQLAEVPDILRKRRALHFSFALIVSIKLNIGTTFLLAKLFPFGGHSESPALYKHAGQFNTN